MKENQKGQPDTSNQGSQKNPNRNQDTQRKNGDPLQKPSSVTDENDEEQGDAQEIERQQQERERNYKISVGQQNRENEEQHRESSENTPSMETDKNRSSSQGSE